MFLASFKASEFEIVGVSRSFYRCFYAYNLSSMHVHWFARSLLPMTSYTHGSHTKGSVCFPWFFTALVESINIYPRRILAFHCSEHRIMGPVGEGGIECICIAQVVCCNSLSIHSRCLYDRHSPSSSVDTFFIYKHHFFLPRMGRLSLTARFCIEKEVSNDQ